jgi:hypothetical protein
MIPIAVATALFGSTDAASIDRRQIEDGIEWLIGLLDGMEPDPDLEPSLAGSYWAASGGDDRELDNSDDEDGHDAEWCSGAEYGVADRDALADPELSFSPGLLAFTGEGTAIARAMLEDRATKCL